METLILVIIGFCVGYALGWIYDNTIKKVDGINVEKVAIYRLKQFCKYILIYKEFLLFLISKYSI